MTLLKPWKIFALLEKCPNTEFSGPYFPGLGLNTEIYFVNLCIQSEYRKIRTWKNSVFGLSSGSVIQPGWLWYYPPGIYLLKVNNRNTRTRCEICPKLTIQTPERRLCCHSGVFSVNFVHISHPALLSLSLALNM